MPGHADEEGAVVTIVRRPPGLTVGHQGGQVTLDCGQIQRLERLGVVEAIAHGVARLALLMQDVHRDLVGPPVAVGAPQQRAQRGWLLLGIMKRGGAACLSVHGFPPVGRLFRRTYARFGAKGKSINFESSSRKIYDYLGQPRLASVVSP
ncbi:hypothetical protein D3C85_1370520 [compost metagenome]